MSQFLHKFCHKFSMPFNPLHFCDMNDFTSCRYMENRSGDRFPPCRTPMLQLKKSDCFSAVNATLDLAFTYMFSMISNNFPEIPEASIFDHNVDLFIVSNVFFFKSTKQQYNCLRLLRYRSASDFRTNRWSIVEKSNLKPACSACKILLFSLKVDNLLFKKLVNSLQNNSAVKFPCSCWEH